MKVSEYIKHLQMLKSEHGDLEVMTYGYGGVCKAHVPKTEHLLILKGRESKPRYWGYEGKDRIGELVIDV